MMREQRELFLSFLSFPNGSLASFQSATRISADGLMASTPSSNGALSQREGIWTWAGRGTEANRNKVHMHCIVDDLMLFRLPCARRVHAWELLSNQGTTDRMNTQGGKLLISSLSPVSRQCHDSECQETGRARERGLYLISISWVSLEMLLLSFFLRRNDHVN